MPTRPYTAMELQDAEMALALAVAGADDYNWLVWPLP